MRHWGKGWTGAMARIVVYGLGDLGEKLAYALASSLEAPHVLVVAGRSPPQVQDAAAMAMMVAAARGRGLHVQGQAFPLTPLAEAAFRDLAPDVVVFAATRHTWWRVAELPEGARRALARGGFGAWLPAHADLALDVARVLASLPTPPWLLLAPYPDAVAPLVKALGYPRVAGFGNVDELAMVASLRYPGRAVRLVAHHSVEARLFAGQGVPPYRLWVNDQGAWTEGTLERPFRWPAGTRSHIWTAASAARLVVRLLGDGLAPVHVPGPHGLVGGYPCQVGDRRLQLDLPPAVSAEEAAEVNGAGQRADGLERIDPDGRVWFTADCRTALAEAFGLEWRHLALDDMHGAADQLLAKVHEMVRD